MRIEKIKLEIEESVLGFDKKYLFDFNDEGHVTVIPNELFQCSVKCVSPLNFKIYSFILGLCYKGNYILINNLFIANKFEVSVRAIEKGLIFLENRNLIFRYKKEDEKFRGVYLMSCVPRDYWIQNNNENLTNFRELAIEEVKGIIKNIPPNKRFIAKKSTNYSSQSLKPAKPHKH